MAMSSWRRASSAEKPRRSRSRKKPLAQGPVLGGAQRPQDRLDERGTFGDQLTEDLLAGVDVGPGKLPADVGDLQLRVVHPGQAEQDGRVHQREQVVDLEAQ